MIGEELNELRILDVAIKVFTSVWKYYKKIRKQYCVEAISVAITLAKITVEIRSEESYTEVTTYTEEEILREVYESTIKTITTTTITTTTVETCKTLSSFYVRTERWSEALTVCQELLKGLWLSIISGDGTIELPRDFTSEAVEMAIRRAHCHVHVHQNENAEKTLLYIFRATKAHLRIQDGLVIKATRELINFYERINRWDRIIEINREIWEAYSRTLGKTHHMTLEILYHLGELSIKHGGKDAEKYYLEIYLNLDRGSDTCHQRAIEAALALTKIYEMEKRWTDAKIIYSRLWLTIVKYTKEYDITAERVDEVYRRYFFILEELKASYTILRQTTIEFRETCIHTYGARSEITLKATIRLAEINERSEEHVHESIQMYEEIFHETKTTTKTTTITTIITEAKSRLTRLYVKHSSTSTEYTSKAVSLFMEKFETTKSFYGCSHQLTIKQLEELAGFYESRSDQKLTITVLRMLQSTVIEIISEEKDSKRLFDSSIAIAKIYLAHGHTHEANDLLVELRRQIVTRDTRNSERCGFKFNQNIDRRSFVFIATFEETLKGTKTINFSEIMAEFLSETILYEAYTRSLTQKSRFEVTMAHGARLRYFRRSKYHDGGSKIDDELFEAFQKNMGASIKTSKTTTRYFFSILLEESGRTQREVHLVKIGCGSGAASVRTLLEQSKFQEAIDLATCILQFTQSQDGYHDQDNISNSFKIALYLAGRGAQHCSENDPRQRDLMSLSRTFVKEILEASRHMNVDFSKTPVPELNELVSLIGAHQNFNDLEVSQFLASSCDHLANMNLLQWILTQLWNSRHTQTWSTQTIVHIGQRLVEVRFNRGDRDAAIHILEDICYNLRRVWGLLDKTTLQMFTLLSELYTAIGRYEKAMAMHEEILRYEVSDDNDMSSVEDASRNARYHLELLKRAYQRLGKWDKPRDTYITLFDEVTSTFQGEELFRDVQPIMKWPSKGADDRGTFKPPTNWGFITSEDEKKQHQNWLKRVSSVQRYDTLTGKGGKRAPSGLHTYIEHHHNYS